MQKSPLPSVCPRTKYQITYKTNPIITEQKNTEKFCFRDFPTAVIENTNLYDSDKKTEEINIRRTLNINEHNNKAVKKLNSFFIILFKV